VGLAIGSGTDVAKETGDVILIKDDVRDVVKALESLRRPCVRSSKICLGLCLQHPGHSAGAGLFYPFVSLIISPELAAAFMAVSSVSVTLKTPCCSKTVQALYSPSRYITTR